MARLRHWCSAVAWLASCLGLGASANGGEQRFLFMFGFETETRTRAASIAHESRSRNTALFLLMGFICVLIGLKTIWAIEFYWAND